MEIEGGCYCGKLRYHYEGEPMFQGQCHCRECQYLSGGAPNMVIGLPGEGFNYTQGEPALFTRDDLETPVTREFCGDCGTHILARPPGFPGVVLKVGTMDDSSAFSPQMAIYTCDAQPYHQVPDGVMQFEKTPG
jgi:hypothetical protein